MEDLQRQALSGEGCTKECHAQSVMRAVAMAFKQQPRRRLRTKTADASLKEELPSMRERLPKRNSKQQRPLKREKQRQAASVLRLTGWKRSAKMTVTCQVCGREVRKDVLARPSSVCKRHAA